jgi:hypothetical protein
MKTFISWSGKKSKKAANALQNWLPKVIQAADPWMSTKNIGAGKNSLEEISKALKQARCGVLCITEDNMTNPWIIYEAGALHNNEIRVCPYVIDLNIERGKLPSPLRQMNAEMADLDGTEKLVIAINEAIKNRMDVNILKEAVRSNWGELEKELERIRNENWAPVKDYEKIIEDFVTTFIEINTHRTGLNFSPLVDEAIKSFAAKKYKREIIIKQAFETVEESRNLFIFNRESKLVGNAHKFFNEHFKIGDMRKIIDRLEPVIFSRSSPDIKREKLLRRIEIVKLEFFLRFHQILVGKLREQLSKK